MKHSRSSGSSFDVLNFLKGSILQFILIGAIVYGAYLLFLNTQANLRATGIESGFAFLGREAGLPIGDHLIEYNPTNSYGRAFLVGITNTLFVAVIAIFFSTILGVIVGISRVSKNWLLSKTAAIYVETLRNIPLLLTLLFIYFVVLKSLPSVKTPLIAFDGIFLTNRGLFVPKPIAEQGFTMAFFITFVVATLAVVFIRWAKQQKELTGKTIQAIPIAFLGTLIAAFIIFWAHGFPVSWKHPELVGFNFKGGIAMKPEFCALLIGLVLYTAAYIGENVRSGIESVHAGQLEASNALGVPTLVTMRKILLPQALRVTIPSTTNDYASLVKNSSLAVAIGYPDMVSVGGTILGQNGQAIEIIALWMAVYLTINIIISTLMNWLNSHIQIVER